MSDQKVCGQDDAEWMCELLDGWEVKVVSEGFREQLANVQDMAAKLELIESLDNLVTLQHGRTVLVMGIVGWCFGTVLTTGTYFSTPHVENEGSVWPLREAKDGRSCWVTTSQINKRCFDFLWKVEP